MWKRKKGREGGDDMGIIGMGKSRNLMVWEGLEGKGGQVGVKG